MSSSCIVPIVEIQNVRSHPNADKLELCDVLGYQMCIPKSAYKNGDIGVYFPADVLMPSKWAEKFNVKQYLKGKDKNRVGKVKLRGEPSFGLIVSIPSELLSEFICKVGDNVATFFEVVKYEPPIKFGCGDAEKYDSEIDPFFEGYSDIENGRIYVDIFKDNEEIIATEKIHGTNCRIGFIKGKKVAGSMNLRRKEPEDYKVNTYWFPWTIPEINNLIEYLVKSHNSVILYGEVFGGSIQNLNYGIESGKGLGFRIFDIKLDGKYQDWNEFHSLCNKFNVQIAPIIYEGPYSMQKMKEICEGKTILIENGHIREGIVIKPKIERTDTKIGRVILKYISIEYSLNDKISDSKDV